MKQLILSLSLALTLTTSAQSFSQAQFEDAAEALALAAIARYDVPSSDSTAKKVVAFQKWAALRITSGQQFASAMVSFYGEDWQTRTPVQQLYAGCSLMCMASSVAGGCITQHPTHSHDDCLKWWRECMRLTCNWILVLQQLGL